MQSLKAVGWKVLSKSTYTEKEVEFQYYHTYTSLGWDLTGTSSREVCCLPPSLPLSFPLPHVFFS